MRDIWNPWHGCVKCSEGCQNCYMFFLDKMRDKNGADIYRTKNGFCPKIGARVGKISFLMSPVKIKSGQMKESPYF